MMRRLMKRLMMGRWGRWLPRAAHRWYATRHGFFWLPCPLCDRPFGGHEMSMDDHIIDQRWTGPGVMTAVIDGERIDIPIISDTASGRMVCRSCGPRARELNRRRDSASAN